MYRARRGEAADMARGKGRKPQKRGAFGSVDKLPSGRHRAQYYGPDGRRHKAPTTFLTAKDARGWLSLRQAEIIRNVWTPPEVNEQPAPRLTFAAYADRWHEHRDLKPRTREHYRKLLDDHLIPAFGALPIGSITNDDVRAWHAKFGKATPTLRSHCYGLLRTIMATAASDGKIKINPCVIRGAGTTKRAKSIRPASLAELETLTTAMPENQRAMILLAAWCALRFGELTELRRRDVDLSAEVVRIERAVVRTEDGFEVGEPKSEAGTRDVSIPPHLVPMIEDHLAKYVDKGKDSLLFPAKHGGHLAPATLYRRFYTARAKAGRDDLRFHDLRHTGAVLAAATGATLAELMARLGHTTTAAAMRYQHAARERDREIAALLSKMAANV
jgi:integrase